MRRVHNSGSPAPIGLEEVQLQYWFDAVLESDARAADGAAGSSSLAASHFKMWVQ